MKIALTNDDGVNEPGLAALARAFAVDGNEVLVVAPSSERSGSGAAVGPLWNTPPIALLPSTIAGAEGAEIYGIDAPPAVAAYAMCLGAFGWLPDLLVSGVNPGPNVGHLVIHSGTVGAAMSAAILGVPAIAVSTWGFADCDFDGAAQAAVDHRELACSHRGQVLNLNLPEQPTPRGFVAAPLARYGSRFETTAKRLGETLQMSFTGNSEHPEPGSDQWLLAEGFATLTLLDPYAAETVFDLELAPWASPSGSH